MKCDKKIPIPPHFGCDGKPVKEGNSFLHSVICKANEWELAHIHQIALKAENFETCLVIKQEVEKRISNGTINHDLMSGFRYWNPKTKKFEGGPKYDNLNGLFDNYK